MSERGSFVTQYIYCADCLAVASRALGVGSSDKFLTATLIPSWEGPGMTLPIVAGKIGATSNGGEIDYMEEIIDDMEPFLCHPVHIAVIPDHGEPFPLVAMPRK